MKKNIIAFVIGALATAYASAVETPVAPAASAIIETPTYLKHDKPAEAAGATPAPKNFPRETKEQRDARMAWWRDARFGMFIHWGVFSVPAGVYKGETFPGPSEYLMGNAKIPVSEYREFAKGFTASNYDADAIVRLAKQAGMKYIVITTKHHDGFAMFPSAASDWNITQTPYGKDILKPLVEACRKHGIKLGFYYSQAVDWINGGACSMDPNNKRTMDEYVDQVAVPQIRELLTNYGDVPAILWWDTPAGMNEERAAKILELLKLKPGVIHNNRLLKMAGHMGVVDMQNLEANKRDPFFGDTETPEQHIPDTGLGERDFEVCMTMNDIWGYKRDDHNWKSTKALLHQLIDIASKGGNYLLNIGPMEDGTVPEPSIERLKEIGKWMSVNSESIYGTTASPFAKLMWGRCTTKKNKAGTTLYLHVFDWPADGKLVVPGLKNTVSSARLLATGEKLTFERNGEDVLVNLPATATDPNATVVKMEIQGEPDVVSLVPLKGGMTASSTWSAPGFEAAKASDDNSGTRWSAAQGTRSGWLEIDLGTEVSVGRALIRETSFPRTEEFALEYLEGNTWKEVAKGTRIAGEKLISFTPVTARRFRLNIQNASDVPTIEEFTLYEK
jgi:alpha-L-fucosidase